MITLNKEFGIVLDDDIVAHILWADDLVLIADTPTDLQRQLNGLFECCSRFQMIVNKTLVGRWSHPHRKALADPLYSGALSKSISNLSSPSTTYSCSIS